MRIHLIFPQSNCAAFPRLYQANPVRAINTIRYIFLKLILPFCFCLTFPPPLRHQKRKNNAFPVVFGGYYKYKWHPSFAGNFKRLFYSFTFFVAFAKTCSNKQNKKHALSFAHTAESTEKQQWLNRPLLRLDLTESGWRPSILLPLFCRAVSAVE